MSEFFNSVRLADDLAPKTRVALFARWVLAPSLTLLTRPPAQTWRRAFRYSRRSGDYPRGHFFQPLDKALKRLAPCPIVLFLLTQPFPLPCLAFLLVPPGGGPSLAIAGFSQV